VKHIHAGPPRLLFNVNVAWFLISHRLPIARAARNSGLEVHVAADIDSDDEIRVLQEEGLIFHRVHLSRGGLNPYGDLGYMAQLRAVMKRLQPHLVHNVTVKPIVYGSVVARSLGLTRIVNSVSGLGYSFSGEGSRHVLAHVARIAYRLALRRRDIRVIFQNLDDMETFSAARIIRPEQAALIRGSGVDLEAFPCAPEPTGVPRVVLPARMLRDKGVVEFAEAAGLLRARGCNAQFLLAGMKDEANPAGLSQQELIDLQRSTGVEWLGHVSDMSSLYRSVHVVCLPSYREGLPKALIEACAVGRPIVTTDVPGCREVVTEGVNGLLVRPRDAAALAQALGRVLADPALRFRMGAEARRRAEAEFDVKGVVRATLNLYREILG